ncbi:MAG: hypothetical protein KF817_07945 [Phycisphaeraceae bacterium]|nr:hypothetical protein [Phycisphaeraceae bacterium]
MSRILLGGVLGGIAMFLWGALIWMGFGLPMKVIANLPDEPAVMNVVRETVTRHGVYWFPGFPEEPAGATDEVKKAVRDTWMEKHRTGPIGLLIVVPDGVDAAQPIFMIRGLAILVAASFLAAILLRAAAGSVRTWVGRAGFVTMLGAIVALSADGANWNWWHYPDDFTLLMAFDRLGAWLIAGIVLATVVKPARRAGD